MRNTIIAVVTAASILFAAPSQAAGKASRQENIGVGSGAVIGALAGGPVGFVIGAALGAKVGHTMHEKNEQIVRLQASVDDSNQTVASLERNIDQLSSQIERLQNVARPELVSLLQAGIAEALEHLVALTLGRTLLGIRVRRLVQCVLDPGEAVIQLAQTIAQAGFEMADIDHRLGPCSVVGVGQ